MTRLRATVLFAVLASVAAAAVAFAITPVTPVTVKKVPSGFDATGVVGPEGRVVRLGGPIECTDTGNVRIHVTLTQRASGAFGRGTFRGSDCTEPASPWTARVRARGQASFRPGRVEVCAAAIALDGAIATDSTQFCRRMRLDAPAGG